MPAVVCTGLCEVATRVGAPRIVRAGRFHHPFGDPEISPDRELVWRKSLSAKPWIDWRLRPKLKGSG